MKDKKKIIGIIVFIGIFVVALICAAVHFIFTETVYTGYEVVSISDRVDSKSAEYEKYCQGFIRYSRDGVTYYDAGNVPQWNVAYEMNSPIIDIKGEYCAVAALGGSQVYMFNKSGLVMNVDTVMNIMAVSVSAEGHVAVILADDTNDYIDMYDSYGDKVYHIKSNIEGNGTPLDIDVSYDGIKLIVSYVCVNGDKLNTSVNFYNFGEVGKNEAERLVGGYEKYENMLVPETRFINENTAVAFGTELVSVYSVKQYPSEVKDIVPEYDIEAYFVSKDYFCLIYNVPDGGYRFDVYDTKGECVAQLEQPTLYNHYAFNGKSILMYNDNIVRIVSLVGTEKFNYTFDSTINAFIPYSRENGYIYINNRKVQKIKLK